MLWTSASVQCRTQHSTDETDPYDPPRMGAKSTTTSNHPSTPDGATDSSICEQELIYLRTAIEGKISTFFLSIEPVGKADATGIKTALFKSFQCLDMTDDQVMAKTVAMGIDGAAVMLGKRNGGITKIQQHQPAVIVIHCMAHRLELAFKKVIAGLPTIEQINRLLLQVYLFYHFSELLCKHVLVAPGGSPIPDIDWRIYGEAIPHYCNI